MVDFIQYINYSFDCFKFIRIWEPKMYAEIHDGYLKMPIVYIDGPLNFVINISKDTNQYYLKLSGSLHKYWNFKNDNLGPDKTGHNYNNYSRRDFCDTLNYLEIKYGISFNEGFLNTLEVGINVNTDLKPEELVHNYVYLFREKSHNNYRNNSINAFKEFNSTNYNVKIYSKSLQYNLDKNILRFEVKHKNARQIKKFGVVRLNDLRKEKVWNELFEHNLTQFDNMLILDPFLHFEDLCKKELLVYNLFTSHQELRKQRKSISRPAIKKRKEKFDKLLLRRELIKTKKAIKEELTKRFKALVNDNHRISKTSK